jgi:hypothetical protein
VVSKWLKAHDEFLKMVAGQCNGMRCFTATEVEMRRIMACFFVLVSSVQVAEARPVCDSDFGTDVQIITEQTSPKWGKYYQDNLNGDFNGDGIKDHIFILTLNKGTKFNRQVIPLNPPVFDLRIEKFPGGKIVLPEKPSFALGIVQSDQENCQKFVIYSPDYFPTYPYGDTFFVVDVVRVGDSGYAQYNDDNLLTERIQHDVIRIANDHIIIYWNGKEFKLELPYADHSQFPEP